MRDHSPKYRMNTETHHIPPIKCRPLESNAYRRNRRIDSREKNWTFFIVYAMTVISSPSPRAWVNRIRRRFLRFIARVRIMEGAIVCGCPLLDTITNSTFYYPSRGTLFQDKGISLENSAYLLLFFGDGKTKVSKVKGATVIKPRQY